MVGAFSTLDGVDLAFVDLAGDPPSDRALAALRSFDGTFDRVAHAWERAVPTTSTHRFKCIEAIAEARRTDRVRVIYLMGHGWLEEHELEVAIRTAAGGSHRLRGAQILDAIASLMDAPAVLVFVDTCHALALESALDAVRTPHIAIFASASDEASYELPLDGATHLALAASRALAIASTLDPPLDPLVVAALAVVEGRRDKTWMAPKIDYRMGGAPFRVRSALDARAVQQRRLRTARVRKALLVVTGSFVALATIAAIVLYRSMWVLEVDVGELPSLYRGARLAIYRQATAKNASDEIYSAQLVPGGLLRVRLLTGDFVLSVEGEPLDGRPRKVCQSVVVQSTFAAAGKRVRWQLPSAAEVRGRPGMALVSAVRWQRGTELEESEAPRAFWIDIWPVTLRELAPFIDEQLGAGKGPADRSSPLVATLLQDRALKNLGIKKEALRDLDRVLEVIGREGEPLRKQDPMAAPVASVNSFDIPCDECPAFVSMREATEFCATRGMRLPTRDQWELAARGVDGRRYPWGDRFDSGRANVVGLPKKGQGLALLPVYAFPRGASPFGVEDLVGNAGDWIDGEGGFATQSMGGHYRFNPEDATVYSNLPITDTYSYEIGFRCVVEAGSGPL